jgi:histone H3/H4
MARTKQTARPSKDKEAKKAHRSRLEKKEKRHKRKLKDHKRAHKTPLGVGGIKKPHRFHPGVQAAREIARFSGGKDATTICTQRAPVERLLREIVAKYRPGEEMRVQADAVTAFQELIESSLVTLFEKTQELATLSKKVTISPAALRIAAKTVFGEGHQVEVPVHHGSYSHGGNGKRPHAPAKSPSKKAKKVASASSGSSTSGDEGTEDTEVVVPTAEDTPTEAMEIAAQ